MGLCYSAAVKLKGLKTKQKIFRLVSPVLYPLVRIYWRVARPKGYGAKVIIACGKEILAVRHTYGLKKWTFPGGKIEKGEDPTNAALREISEELGVTLPTVRLLGRFESTSEGKRDNVFVFHAVVGTKEVTPDTFEIEEVGWFTKNSLPPLGPVARRMFEMYEKNGLT